GDSIRALRVVAAARRHGIEFDIATLFGYPTVAQLAAVSGAASTGTEFESTARFSLLSAADRAKLPSEVVDAYPLAVVQSGLIYHDESSDGKEVYKDLFVYEIEAAFDENVFRAAVARLIERHDALRTSIDLENFSLPMQLVHADVAPIIEIERLERVMSPAETRAFVDYQRARSFVWHQPPFIRFIIRLRPDARFELFLAFHDLLLDGWSASLLVSELLLTYDKLLGNPNAAALPAPNVRFADYIAAELGANRSTQAREFFARYLADAPVHRFPVRRPTNSVASLPGNDAPRFAVQDVPISAALSGRLRAVASSLGVSVKHLLLAAHVKVLSQVFGDYDILTGLESNGRLEDEDGEAVIGMHLNTVPLRVRCAGGTWRQLIHQVYEGERELLPVRRYSYTNLQRTLGRGDLVDTVFNHVHFHGFRRLAQLRHLQVKSARGYGASHFSYRSEFSIDPFSGRIHLCLECDTNALDPGLIREMGEDFVATLNAMTADVDGRHERVLAPVGTGAGASAAAGASSVAVAAAVAGASAGAPAVAVAGASAGAPAVVAAGAATWLSAWQSAVRTASDGIAMVYRWRQFSFAAIGERARRWAGVLAERAVTRESCVAILLGDPLDYCTAIIAIHWAGGAYVPLNPRQPWERNRKILAGGKIAWVITEAGEDLSELPELERVEVRTLDAGRTLPEAAPAHPDQLAYVIYTSGSTGTPKGVMVSQHNLVFSLQSRLDYYADTGPMTFLL